MKNVRKRHRLWLSAGGLALGAVVAAVFAATAVGRPSATPLKIAIMSDCQGAFAANYEQDIGGAITAFVNGTAGAWDTTAVVKAPNFFRFNGDGIQWNAGIGDLAVRKLHWKKAAIIMDDYSFGYASGAGMVADFCAAGGTITKRVFPPLNTTDYSSFVRQLPPPSQVDGYFSAVGGSGTPPMLKA